MMSNLRLSKVERKTEETQISLEFNLDGQGRFKGATQVPFLDHMLVLFAKHGLFDLEIEASGDIEVDDHHTVEDVGLSLGEALLKSLGSKEGINRYGSILLPMDEALVACAVDISGRPYLDFPPLLKPTKESSILGLSYSPKIGDFDLSLIKEFFKAFTASAKLTLHIKIMAGENIHHIIEAMFKALGKALSQAVTINPRVKGLPSTKGKL